MACRDCLRASAAPWKKSGNIRVTANGCLFSRSLIPLSTASTGLAEIIKSRMKDNNYRNFAFRQSQREFRKLSMSSNKLVNYLRLMSYHEKFIWRINYFILYGYTITLWHSFLARSQLRLTNASARRRSKNKHKSYLWWLKCDQFVSTWVRITGWQNNIHPLTLNNF